MYNFIQISKLKVNKHKGRKKSMTVKNTTVCRKKYGKSLVDDAVQEAETMMLQSVKERLKKIQFIVKPKKMLGTMKKVYPMHRYIVPCS